MKPLAIRINSKSLTLIPACCLHWPIGEKDLLREWVERVRTVPDARTILLGDSLDLARAHYRNHMRSYRDDENSQEALDEYARREVVALAKELEPIKGRIIGALRGNHFWEFADQTNSEQYLCQLLGIPYLGALGLIRVAFSLQRKHPMSQTKSLVIFAHHSGGTAGARTTGGDVAGVARNEAGFDADIFLLGHTHRKIAWKDTTLTLTAKSEPRIVDRSKVFARCGSFLKGFKEDHPNTSQRHAPSYAELKAYRPTDLGWVEIEILWRRARVTGTPHSAVEYPQYTLRY